MNEFIQFISISIDDTIRSISSFYPEVVLVIGFIIVILADLFLSKRFPHLPFRLTILILTVSIVANFNMLGQTPVQLFGGMILLDHLAVLFKIIFSFISILFVLFI